MVVGSIRTLENDYFILVSPLLQINNAIQFRHSTSNVSKNLVKNGDPNVLTLVILLYRTKIYYYILIYFIVYS